MSEDNADDEREIASAVRRDADELSRTLAQHHDHVEKISVIQQKYTELLENMHRLERDHVRTKAMVDQFQNERDRAKSETGKVMNMKQKLETLCRELQKESRRVKEESVRVSAAEQQKRDDLSVRFEATIKQIKDRMQLHEKSAASDAEPHPEPDASTTLDDTVRLPDDALANGDTSSRVKSMSHEKLKKYFTTFLDQYALREKHFQAAFRVKDLELKLCQARLAAEKKRAEEEASRARTLHAQVWTVSQTESELRTQLNVYVEKFKQVEDTLNSSNDLFLTFRKEMEAMTKKTKVLERENLTIKTKCDAMKSNVVILSDERTRYTKELELAQKKIAKLEQLSRALQNDNTGLRKQLKELADIVETDDENEYEDDGEFEEEEEYEGDEDEEVIEKTVINGETTTEKPA